MFSSSSSSSSLSWSTPTTTPTTTSTSMTETVNGSHLFNIAGYSLLNLKGIGIGNYVASDTFTAGDYSWAIYFYPDGKKVQYDAPYASLFIVLASEGTDVRAFFELKLLDQSGKGRHKVHTQFDSGPYTIRNRGSMWYRLFFLNLGPFFFRDLDYNCYDYDSVCYDYNLGYFDYKCVNVNYHDCCFFAKFILSCWWIKSCRALVNQCYQEHDPINITIFWNGEIEKAVKKLTTFFFSFLIKTFIKCFTNFSLN